MQDIFANLPSMSLRRLDSRTITIHTYFHLETGREYHKIVVWLNAQTFETVVDTCEDPTAIAQLIKLLPYMHAVNLQAIIEWLDIVRRGIENLDLLDSAMVSSTIQDFIDDASVLKPDFSGVAEILSKHMPPVG